MEKAGPLLKSLIIPFCTVLLALLAYSRGWLAGVVPQIVTFSVILLLLIAIGLSIGFKKSHFFFILLLLTINYLFQSKYPGAYAVQQLLLFLFPLNIFIFAWLSERGIMTFWGKIRLGWILLQVFIVYSFIIDHHIILEAKYLQALPIFLPAPLNYLLAAFYIGILITLSMIKFKHSFSTFISLIITVCFGLYYGNNSLSWPLFTATAAIIIIVAAVQVIYRLAFIDELTGLYSRRCFNLDMMRLSGTYTMAMLDIDHFKRLNDTYGHDVGDQVLRYITSFMRRTPRGVKAYRYGGEEFAVVFSGIGKSDAVPYLEDLRKTMSQRSFMLRSQDRPQKKPKSGTSRHKDYQEIAVTVSIGVADNGRKNFNPDDVIKAADKALYQAKKNGRNRTCLYN
ncbi:MAG: GGDEF domain-containing protein [Chitinophagales bacterium]